MLETGLSDFLKIIVTVMKTTYEKLKLRIISYRDYKNFCNETFRQILLEKLAANCNGFEIFLQICINTLDIFAPCKKKYARGNNMPFMNKPLAKAHMKRSRLRNLYLKKKTELHTSSNATTVYLFCGKLRKATT